MNCRIDKCLQEIILEVDSILSETLLHYFLACYYIYRTCIDPYFEKRYKDVYYYLDNTIYCTLI